MLNRLSKILLCVSCIFIWSNNPRFVDAGVLKVHVTGRVTDWDGGLGAQFSVGDLLNLDYTFDSQAIDKVPNLTTYGQYDFLSFEGKLGSYVFKATKSLATTTPQSFPFGDQFFIYGEDMLGNDVAGAHLADGAVFLRDYDATFLNGDKLPLSAPDLSIMEQSGFILDFDHPVDGRILVRADLISTSIQEVSDGTVPEPSSILVLVGLCMTAAITRRKRR